VATVIPIDELSFSPTAALFEGGEEIAASIFITAYDEPGKGPGLHVHPYPEAFVVHDGTAIFTVDGEELTVAAGHVVVVPAETPHAFRSAGEETLRVVSVHPRGSIEQTWL
jgi:mannose-6-phosphate isomerase-like protein (cupin superfamily)